MVDGNSTVAYRDIPGFPGYRVGSDGTVWSCWKMRPIGWRGGLEKYVSDTWKMLKPGRHRDGHLRVIFCANRSRYCRRVHRLVLEAFVGACPAGMQCCHNDGDPANNNLDNLRWDTPKANSADRLLHGTDSRGERSVMAKLTEDDVRSIRAGYATGQFTQKQLGRRYGVVQSTIGTVIRRRSWQHVV